MDAGDSFTLSGCDIERGPEVYSQSYAPEMFRKESVTVHVYKANQILGRSISSIVGAIQQYYPALRWRQFTARFTIAFMTVAARISLSIAEI